MNINNRVRKINSKLNRKKRAEDEYQKAFDEKHKDEEWFIEASDIPYPNLWS